jgi:hypothetical protein
MMKTISKLATGKNILILLALFLLANFVVVPLVYPKFQTLDMLTRYTPAQAYELISSYGEQGRQTYAIIEVTLDLVYPFVSALLFSLLILYSFQHGFPNQKWAHWLALLPFAVMASDYLENTFVLILLLEYPRELAGAARTASFFTTAKLVLTPFELLFVLGFVGWLIRAIWIKRKA